MSCCSPYSYSSFSSFRDHSYSSYPRDTPATSLTYTPPTPMRKPDSGVSQGPEGQKQTATTKIYDVIHEHILDTEGFDLEKLPDDPEADKKAEEQIKEIDDFFNSATYV